MATIDTENLAKGLQQVEACWQAYTSSQRLVEGLAGSDRSSAIETANRDFTAVNRAAASPSNTAPARTWVAA